MAAVYISEALNQCVSADMVLILILASEVK